MFKNRQITRKIALGATLILASVFFAFFRPPHTRAAGTVYYFNNAVNTNPATLGNYWLNLGHTVHATQLPDLSVDDLNILHGANYVGNAIFNDSAINNGTVTGNATFNGDLSENSGTVTGTKTRHYTSTTTSTRDFTSDGSWTVLADGIVVDMSEAAYDGTTTFLTTNGGSFVYLDLIFSRREGNHIYLEYNTSLNTGSVPSAGDFSVTVNGDPVGITGVSISGQNIVLTMNTSPSTSDTVKLIYTKGVNPIQNTLSKDADAISQRLIIKTITLGGTPFYFTFVGTKIFISDQTDSDVLVVDTNTDTVVDTIPVGTSPTGVISNGKKVYVSNSGDGTVSVIDTSSDTVVATVTVGDNPTFSNSVGNKVYINNADSISVINTATDAISSTIPAGVGGVTSFSAVIGKKLYRANQNDNTITVVDTDTDSVVTTIPIVTGNGPSFITAVGTKAYASDLDSPYISVIDSTTDSVVASVLLIAPGPYFSSFLNNKLYVNNANEKSVSVIDTNTDTVINTISTGNLPDSSSIVGKRVYVGSQYGVNVIDTDTDSIVDTISSSNNSYFSLAVGKKVYINNIGENNFSVIDDTTLESELPNLTSFSTSVSSGTYTVGQTIDITANFGRTLQSGSHMNVTLNTGRTVALNQLSGSTLSGTYTVGSGDSSPDLAITSISNVSVSDNDGHTRTSYNLPSSVGTLTAENSFITRNLGDNKNIVIGSSVPVTIATQKNPYQVSSPVTVSGEQYIYVANQGSSSVSVIQVSSGNVVATIPVGSEPYGLSTASVSGTTYVYVANTGSDTVSAINTSTNTVAATIPVGVRPYYVSTVGTHVYVTNGLSNTVSVIDATNNTVTATIPVGLYPRGIKAHGTDLYVANYGDTNYSGGNYISVINSLNNTVSHTIILPVGSAGPRGVNVLGSRVYVANFRSNNVSVIDTGSNTIVDTIPVGVGPRGLVGYGTNVYVENFDDGTISVIDTNTDTVTKTIIAGSSPSGISVVGTKIYFSRFQDNRVSIINPSTNTIESVVTTPTSGGSITSSGYMPLLVSGGQEQKDQSVSGMLSNTCHVFTTFMHRGSKNGEVTNLQATLTTLGYVLGVTDGIFGPKTQKAVMSFQTSQGLSPVGYVGPMTRKALYDACTKAKR